MSTPVRAVRISLSVAGICFAIAWGVIGLFVAHIVPPVAPYNTAGGLIALGGHLIALVAITVGAINGISVFIRRREDCTFSDRSLIACTIVLWIVFVSWLAISLSRPVY
jgi:FtsH-binding integral membrane protein